MKLHLSAFVFWCLCFKVLIDVRSGRISLSFLLLRDIFFFLNIIQMGAKITIISFPKPKLTSSNRLFCPEVPWLFNL